MSTVQNFIRRPRFWQQVFAEFIGMFFFLLIGVGTVMSTDVNNPLADGKDFETLYADRQLTIAFGFGISILVLGYTFGHVSGGHFNPAVTISLAVFKHVHWFQASMYIIAQILGASSGTAMLKVIIPEIWHSQFAITTLHENVTEVQGVFLELFGTAMLTMVVFGTAVDERFNVPKGKAPLVAIIPISLTVFLAHILLIPLTGCGINPARSFGSALVALDFKDHWVYWVGPILGGLVGGAISHATNIFNNKLEPYQRIPEEDPDQDQESHRELF